MISRLEHFLELVIALPPLLVLAPGLALTSYHLGFQVRLTVCRLRSFIICFVCNKAGNSLKFAIKATNAVSYAGIALSFEAAIPVELGNLGSIFIIL
jgi:hypothetical protein